jgi:hypothetical protein
MKSLLFLFVLVLLFAPVVSAANVDAEFTVPFNQKYDLKRQCYNNGTYCSSSAVCNATVFYPNGNTLISNSEMTNQIAFHNYTFAQGDLNQLGLYKTGITCNDPSGDIIGNAFNDFFFEVTGDGQQSSPFPYQIGIAVLAFALIVVGKINEELGFLQIMGSIAMVIFGVVTLWPGYSGINYSNLMGQGIGAIALGIGFWFMIENSFSRDKQAERFTQENDGRFHGFD